MPEPYKIDVSDDVLRDLGERLARTRWPEALPGEPWSRGADVAYIRELCGYWADGYDWRKHEESLNAWPMFSSTIDDVDIRYWHVRGKGESPKPLMLVHGWPGSIYEFHHFIEPLTDPEAHGGDPADSFDVVIPCLPGYGFSGKPQEAGWGPTRIAAAFDALMTHELGYERYGTQGGDWGGIVTSLMAANHGEHVIGAHLNFIIGSPTAEQAQQPQAKPYLENAARIGRDEMGYNITQSTKPMSLGIAQSDSPAGIAAWIVEKFRTWSDCDGDVERVFSKDTLLTNIMFYWATNSIASAANLYFESRAEGRGGWPAIAAPVGVAMFPKELARCPREWVPSTFNVVRWTEMPRGGHFAALEQPALLLDDIRAFFRALA
jgi:pimeloyl-ACP methyl ester carboxylesterase